MRTPAALAAWLLLCGAAARADCLQAERSAASHAAGAAAAMDQAGALHAAGEAALKALANCPDSARLWYLAARAAEILDEQYGKPAFPPETAADLAAKAAAHAPQSAPVAVVAARATGRPDDARHAYQLDASYPPARRVYALTLAEAGEADKALGLVTGADRADRLARARILLAARRFAEAAAAARAAEATPPAGDGEPTLESLFRCDVAETLGLALLGQGRRREAQEPLSVAAALGSRKAAAALSGARP